MYVLSRTRYDPCGLDINVCIEHFVNNHSRNQLTVHQRLLNIFLVCHDEGPVLENSLVERLPSDLVPEKSFRKSHL